MVHRVNQANNIQQWKDAEYCAMLFRLQLSGEIEMWLNQTEAAREAWVSDIKEIIVRLERRFETADGKEQAIRRFEEAQQQPDEALSSYLFRLRQMADYAFAKEVPETKRSRVLWCFIAGMNNDFARQEVLRHKWLTAEGKPKEYDEILNVAEEAGSIQMGMRAAVPMTVTGGNDCLPLQGWNNLVHVKGFRNASKSSLEGSEHKEELRQEKEE